MPGVLIVWDDNYGCLWVLPVEHNGPVDWDVRWIVDKLDEIGYRGVAITLKSDQEPAILALKKAVAAKRTGVLQWGCRASSPQMACTAQDTEGALRG